MTSARPEPTPGMPAAPGDSSAGASNVVFDRPAPTLVQGSNHREAIAAGMGTLGRTAAWKSAVAAFLVFVLSGSAWIAGASYLRASAWGSGPWHLLAQGVYWGIFFAATGLGLLVLLRRTNAALVDAAQGALDGSLRYEDMFEHHPTPMWVFDSLTQQFLAVNDAALHRYGYSESEFLGMTLRDIRPEEDVPMFLTHHTNTSRKGYGDAGIWRHRIRTGELIHMHITLNRTTYRGRSGTLVMAREVTRDVEAREALEALTGSLEERVKQRTAELESANLELDAFARSAAHDLRTPLNGILGFTQILQYELAQATPRQRQSLEQIERSAQSMLELVDGLLAMSRVAQKQLVLEEVDLSALAALGIEQLRAAEPGRDVRSSVQAGLKTNGDPTLLSSLLNNLLSNAWKYTSRKEIARVEFGAQVLPDRSRVYFVRDNGVGFPMAQAERLFKPFQRLHSASDYQGHGVGLVTCLRVIQRHGQRIWPVSAVGVGTTIWFTLPDAAAATP
jgi:PAS domain S-box-containing protein